MQTLNWLKLFFKLPHFEWSPRGLYSCKTSQQNLNSEPLLETITWSSPAATSFWPLPQNEASLDTQKHLLYYWTHTFYRVSKTLHLLLFQLPLSDFRTHHGLRVKNFVQPCSGISYGCALRLIVKGITLTLPSTFNCQIYEFVYLPGSGTSMSGSWKKLRRTSFELTLQLSVHACSINWHNKWVTIQNLTGQTLFTTHRTQH